MLWSANCKILNLNHKRNWQRVNRFSRYRIWGAKSGVVADVSRLLGCPGSLGMLGPEDGGTRSSLEPLSCNVDPNSVISLWLYQMLVTEHLTNVARNGTNFWISYFDFYWIKSQGGEVLRRTLFRPALHLWNVTPLSIDEPTAFTNGHGVTSKKNCTFSFPLCSAQ